MINYDEKAGVHYGVINSNNVGEEWWERSEAVYPCEECGEKDGPDCERDCSPEGFIYDKGGYLMIQDADSPELMVIKSPYYTMANVCSPCFPNAGDLDTPNENGIKTYCLGPEWWEDEKAPYPVYKI